MCVVGSSARRIYDSAARIGLPVIRVLEETRSSIAGRSVSVYQLIGKHLRFEVANGDLATQLRYHC